MNNTGSNKAVASIVAGGIVTIAAWAIHQFAGVEIPAEVAAAATMVMGTVAVYVVPHGGDTAV